MISQNSTDIVTRLMFSDVAKSVPISREEEEELFKLYKKTTNARTREAIRNKIICANMRFVLQIAKHYSKITGADLNELMTEGKLGLFRAVDKYEIGNNTKFISFAVWDIKGSINKYLDEQDIVHIPAHAKSKILKARKDILVGNTESITPEIESLLELANPPMSFDAPISTGVEDEITLADVIKDNSIQNQETTFIKEIINAELRESIKSSLNNEEWRVIESMFGFLNYDNNIKDTETLIGKSRERVRQIRDHALSKLRKNRNIKHYNKLMQSANAE